MSQFARGGTTLKIMEVVLGGVIGADMLRGLDELRQWLLASYTVEYHGIAVQ